MRKKNIQANYKGSDAPTVLFLFLFLFLVLISVLVSFSSGYKFPETFHSIIINLIRISEI